MPKVTLDDRTAQTPPKSLRAETRDALYGGIYAALKRIGDEEHLIEIIKVQTVDIRSRVILASDPSVTEPWEIVNIKMVIRVEIPTEGHPTQVKIERNTDLAFSMMESNEIIDRTQQLTVRTFQNCIALLSEALLKQSENLRTVLSELGMREQDSGNSNRCDNCGCMLIIQGDKRICKRCQRLLVKITLPTTQQTPVIPQTQFGPTCPNCGHVTIKNGSYSKCENCGETIMLLKQST